MEYGNITVHGTLVQTSNTGLQIGGGTTASRPSATVAGQLRYNSNSAHLEYSNGSSWTNLTTVSNTTIHDGWLTLTYSDNTVANVGYVMGPQGPIGNTGLQGNTGDPGANGVGVINAVVNGSYALLLGLSNGATINAGVVTGSPGSYQPYSNTLTDLSTRTIGASQSNSILDRAAADGRYYTYADNAVSNAVIYSSTSPTGLGTTNSVGSANTIARGDHVHQFPLATISNTIVTANTALTLNDHGRVVVWDFANSSLILPNTFPAGFNCIVCVANSTGVPTFTANTGTTIRQADSYTKARKQWSEVSVRVHTNANGAAAVYILSGDMR